MLITRCIGITASRHWDCARLCRPSTSHVHGASTSLKTHVLRADFSRSLTRLHQYRPATAITNSKTLMSGGPGWMSLSTTAGALSSSHGPTADDNRPKKPATNAPEPDRATFAGSSSQDESAGFLKSARSSKDGFFAALRQSPPLGVGFTITACLPMIAAPVGLLASGVFDTRVVFAQSVYTATLVSALAGMRWGAAMVATEADGVGKGDPTTGEEGNDAKGATAGNMSIGTLGMTLAPVVAGSAALLAPFPASVGVLATTLFVLTHYDLRWPGYPGWFKALRLLLSSVAFVSLWTTFILGFSMPLFVKKRLTERQRAAAMANHGGGGPAKVG